MNYALVVCLLTLCAAGYILAWRNASREKYDYALILLMVCGVILRFYTASDLYLHTWDESFHALVAKNLIRHPLLPTLYENPVIPYDVHNWTANHIWLHKPPFPLWMMAYSMKIFGVNEFALRLPSVLLSTTGIFLTFSIAGQLLNKWTGFFAAFLFSINGLIIELLIGA